MVERRTLGILAPTEGAHITRHKSFQQLFIRYTCIGGPNEN